MRHILIIIILSLLLSFFSFRSGYKLGNKIHKPTAIEVYQGKTTLEYKIVDGNIIDSVVIYKP